jgi:hypothetical protein
VEISHEALITAWPRLRAWLDNDRAGLVVARQLTESAVIWRKENDDPASLYRGTRLAAAREWAEAAGLSASLSPLAREFLDASVQRELDDLLRRYNVSVDPNGVVTYPDGPLGWLLEQGGIKPQKMTAGEAALLDDIGLAGTKDAYDIYKTAIHDAENVFDGAGITDGHSDAFRHAYWNAMLANRFGPEWTEQYTTAHERVDTNSASAEAMDLHNNEVGRRIAAEDPDAGPEELKGYIEGAVRNGEMVVVGPDGRLVPSNEVPIGETGRAQDAPAIGGNDPKAQDKYEDNTSGGYNPGSDGDNYGTYDN